MKTAIATVSIPGDLRRKLKAIARAGFDGVEIFEQDFIAQEMSPRDVGTMIRDHGLEIPLFQPFRDFETLPEPHRARAFDRAERKFDLMQEMGTDLVLVCSSVHPRALGGIDRAAEDFRELGERAAKRGLRIGFEALAWGRHFRDHRDVWEVVRRADHPSVGMILDSFHTLARQIDPDTIRAIPGDKIFFVQLADAPKIDMDLLYWSRHYRNMPGEGDLDVTGFMRAVCATGYAGPVSLEIFNDQFRAGKTEALARDGHRSLVHLMDEVRRAEPDLRQDLPVLPERAEVSGVAFVEFTTSEAERPQLNALLKSLGFAKVGQHISKQVTLWQQGEVRIVVNTEEQGFAHAAFLTHGTGVCDIGLMVDDAKKAQKRAVGLGAVKFAQPLGEGELDIPAIRGAGGSLMHFLDGGADLSRVWSAEFTRCGAGASRDAGLTRVDHIAQTTDYDEMLSWSLFYSAIFRMGRAPMVDVVDPDGLVRSQALQSADGQFRVTLNGAETHRTLAGHFLADSFGSSVQHVAFASDDIFATAAAMAEQGFEPLPISPNYYEDLAARFGLEAAEVARMKAFNILYDEDENGAFCQFYSRPWGDGLFFEIVERRGGYDGYGAPNAPFRIAAQKRLLGADVVLEP
ncbi:bifunctional sugar phosphate isomerase/epimerase/4-hydroxyphenylpyruvate dioxygenase family protein [Mangrovicoccus algicola]|uniref:3-dehydroshikimate dehydratase n=1 Tax=Mangrovicoccus algicola TaxID=2771008 RepID=A0A8J7CL69_9RHOB|nr:sugar phosphate isomerase/epimerase and 4-hydroxyphenylpyruvate domain-containing protein [Mangrovicoccus algicola]MBE3639571.1 sugar phosphate isomerase/epimerase and 4-hydroxyphenylpyruvate domain-containing protein [Mangrovicoccus algicola]